MYQVQGFQTPQTDFGCDAERDAETLKDARKEAKYMLTDEYRRACEASQKLYVVQIWKDNELIEEWMH